CAHQCIEASDYRCESFSYDERKRICLLSNVTTNPAVIVQNIDSRYYRRTFADFSLSYQLEELTSTVIVEKNLISTGICADSLDDSTISILCEQFGFEQPLKTINVATHLFPKDSHIWNVECLRSSSCVFPTQKISETNLSLNYINDGCHSILRCSKCPKHFNFACRLSDVCIPISSVCNDVKDCSDGSDEDGCTNPKWRLIGANQSDIGRAQVFLHNSWSDICLDELNETQTNIFCNMMGKGSRSRILPTFTQLSTTTFRIVCNKNNCWPKGINACRLGILNLKCIKNGEQGCGTQTLTRSSDTSNLRRFRRIVGGVTTLPGSYPWVASLKFKNGYVQHCGATVISETHLITAAHCFEEDKEMSDFIIIVGDWDSEVDEGTEQEFNISRLHFYPLYEGMCYIVLERKLL
uniref:Uncharacterized protein n=1 Tax=Panagrolaimus sp. PS1159 TaxID=55785 RepID=A0AC35GFG1_9BILA